MRQLWEWCICWEMVYFCDVSNDYIDNDIFWFKNALVTDNNKMCRIKLLLVITGMCTKVYELVDL